MMRSFKISFLSNCHVYNAVLLAVVTLPRAAKGLLKYKVHGQFSLTLRKVKLFIPGVGNP